MKKDALKPTGRKMAKFWIWTIKNHDVIAASFRLYVFMAVATILVLCLAGVIALEVALNSILFGGLTALALMWVMIENRRSALLKISDPELKEQAYLEMLKFLAPRWHKIQKKEYIWNRILKKLLA